MKLTTNLPISHTNFAHWHIDDSEVGIVVAKATFTLTSDGQVRPLADAPELGFEDIFDGDPAQTPLTVEQDIAPHKPRTDLIIRGFARSFEGVARTDWPVTVDIPDVLHYGFHVRGPSQWEKQRKGWKLSDPMPVNEVPLSYALAYGGQCGEDDTLSFFDENPAGTGHMIEAALDDATSFAAPQIGLLAEFMGAAPFEPMSVMGTMPIAKTWLPRRSLAGTFDSAWERDRHPRMPLDYDLAFWNTAPTPLQIKPHLKGDEKIRVTGVSKTYETVALRLPGALLALRSVSTPDAPLIPLALDTVDLDLAHVDDGGINITMLWRAIVPQRDDYTHSEIIRG